MFKGIVSDEIPAIALVSPPQGQIIVSMNQPFLAPYLSSPESEEKVQQLDSQTSLQKYSTSSLPTA